LANAGMQQQDWAWRSPTEEERDTTDGHHMQSRLEEDNHWPLVRASTQRILPIPERLLLLVHLEADTALQMPLPVLPVLSDQPTRQDKTRQDQQDMT
jgi:hypothetical protein